MSESTLPVETIEPVLAEIKAAQPAGQLRVFPRIAWKEVANVLLLGLILVVGAYLRFTGLDWDEDQHLHPDERFLTMVETGIAPAADIGEYFDTSASPLNPYNRNFGFFVYGTLPIFVVRYAAEWLGKTGFGEVHLVGRAFSAFADLLTVLLVYLIGLRLYRRAVGLLAAALAAVTVLQIQQAHFFTVDTFATLFVAAAFYFAVGAMQEGKLRNYMLFGLLLGTAVASRINVAPLAIVIVLAACVRLAPAYQTRRESPEAWNREWWQAVQGLALAGIVSLLAFRIFQPYAFQGPSVFGLRLNKQWLANMSEIQAQVSGEVDFPPGHQWADRLPVIFPLANMVLWGMGLPLGLTVWAGFMWAAWRMIRSWVRSGRDAPATPGVVMGQNVPAATPKPELGRADWQKHLLPVVWTGLYFGWQSIQWVKPMRYQLPAYPTLVILGAWGIVELWEAGRRASELREIRELDKPWHAGSSFNFISSLISPLALGIGALVVAGTALWAFAFLSIYTRPVTRVSASRWIYENVPGPLTVTIQTASGSRMEPVGIPDGYVLEPQIPFPAGLTPKFAGDVSHITLGRVRESLPGAEDYILDIRLAADSAGETSLAGGRISGDFSQPAAAGPRTVVLDKKVRLEAGQTYYLVVTSLGDTPLSITGATLVQESSWDDALPLRLDGRDGFGGIYRGQNLELYWEDNADKVELMQTALDEGNYIVISSNRQYGSIPRLPMRYPVTVAYYRALFGCPEPESIEVCGARLTPENFAGTLGYDLVATFQSNPQLGPLEINDQLAEEPFTVYDHPKVLLFRKAPDYSSERVAQVFDSVDLNTVVFMTPLEATRTGARSRIELSLLLPADRLAAQRTGGTWSELFHAESLLNRSQPLGVLSWWLAVVALGWLAYPFTRIALGGLPDRGYPLAKVVGLLLVSWFAWILGSYQVPFVRATLWGCVLLLAALSGGMAYLDRDAFLRELRERRRYFLSVEALALGFFLLFLLIRLGNSDLWHPSFGGEKPMDFSYLNAVLKSTSFPPYDPWFAGGYINYYYYGFVFVGVLIKLLALVPAFAYNLVLPMLFSFLAMGAFSVAYNLVEEGRREDQVGQSSLSGPNGLSSRNGPLVTEAIETNQTTETSKTTRLLPSPYLAGIAAALAVVVLGNLAQVKLLLDGFAAASNITGMAPSALGLDDAVKALDGFLRVATGQEQLPYGPGSYYWDATRTIPPGGGEAGPIAEFPFFTFLYADLHAHMIDLPLTALGLAWAINIVLGAKRRKRIGEWAAIFLLGGLAYGVMRPTNTWDFPVYLALGAVAAAVSAWFERESFDYKTLLTAGWRPGLLVVLALLLFFPYGQWYGQAYDSAELWQGSRTPLSAYFRVHGLFLFLLISLLIVETRRWLAETPLRALSKVKEWQGPALFLLATLSVFTLTLVLFGYVIGLVVAPLAAWSAALMLRPGQPVEKRAVFAFAALGLLLTLVVEMVVLSGDTGRMNTVFKFYLQVWSLFGVSAGAAVAWLWAERSSWLPGWRRAWSIILAVLVGSAALYTVTAANAKIHDRFPRREVTPVGADPSTDCRAIPGMPLPYEQGLAVEDQPYSLNGADYMKWSAQCDQGYFLPLLNDYDAIRWMQQHVEGSPVIVEANTPEYRWGSRFTIYTGLPGVVGWNWHQRQQRAALASSAVQDRVDEVGAFYLTPSTEEAMSFLRKYDVSYVVVGGLERAYYDPEALAKFEAMVESGDLRVAYGEPGGTRVYEVMGG